MRNDVAILSAVFFLSFGGCGGPRTQECSSNGYSLRVELLDPNEIVGRRKKQLEEMDYSADAARGRALDLHEDLKRSITFRLHLAPDDIDSDAEGERRDAVFSESANSGDYSRNLHRMLFQLAENIILVDADGIAHPADNYHMERTFGLTPGRTIMVSFPRDKIQTSTKNELILQIQNVGPFAQMCKFRFPA